MPDASQIPGPHLYLYAAAAVMTALLVPLSSVLTEYFRARKAGSTHAEADADERTVEVLTEIRDNLSRVIELHEQAAEDRNDREIKDRLARGERERGEMLAIMREVADDRRRRRGRYQG